MPGEWLRFGDVCRKRCGEQAQYGSRYIDGRLGYPNLGEGLRFRAEYGGPLDTSDYHFIEIHKDDVEEFVARFKAYKQANGR